MGRKVIEEMVAGDSKLKRLGNSEVYRSYQSAKHLINQVRQSELGDVDRLSTQQLTESLIQASKMLFALAQLDDGKLEDANLPCKDSLEEMAIESLLTQIPLLPSLDPKLGNPRLPAELEAFSVHDLEMIDLQSVDLRELVDNID